MGILSGETWGGSTMGAVGSSGMSARESHQIDIRDEAYSRLIDDDLPFDLFQDVRALVCIDIPDAYGMPIAQRYAARFHSGAVIELTEGEFTQAQESLRNFTARLTDYGISSLPSSPAIVHEQVSGLKRGRCNVTATLLQKGDIAAYQQRTKGFPLEFAEWKAWTYLDTLRGDGQIGCILVGGVEHQSPVRGRHYDGRIGIVGQANVNEKVISVKWDYGKACWIFIQ